MTLPEHVPEEREQVMTQAVTLQEPESPDLIPPTEPEAQPELLSILAHRTIRTGYGNAWAGDIVTCLLDTALAAYGITAGTIDRGLFVVDYQPPAVSIKQLLDDMGRVSVCKWWVDGHKRLHFVQSELRPAGGTCATCAEWVPVMWNGVEIRTCDAFGATGHATPAGHYCAAHITGTSRP